MADPALSLDQAKRLMDALYEPGDTLYVCAYNDRNKLYWTQSHLTYGQSFEQSSRYSCPASWHRRWPRALAQPEVHPRATTSQVPSTS